MLILIPGHLILSQNLNTISLAAHVAVFASSSVLYAINFMGIFVGFTYQHFTEKFADVAAVFSGFRYTSIFRSFLAYNFYIALLPTRPHCNI